MALTMSVLFINYSPSMPGLGTPMAQTGIVRCQADRCFQEETSATAAMPGYCAGIVQYYWE